MLIFEDVVVVEVTRWAWMSDGGEEHFYARDFEASTSPKLTCRFSGKAQEQ
jgi:hypothetical protein